RLDKESRKDKSLVPAFEEAKKAKAALEEGTGVLKAGLDLALLRDLHLMTAKRFIYVFNCDTDELQDEDLKERMRALVAPSEAIFLDAKSEAELVELGDDEEAEQMRAEMLADMGVEEPGLDALARVGFDTLGL